MFFFNSLKTKTVEAFFLEAFQNANIPELPPKGARNSKSCGRSGYDTVNKKYCSYTLRTKIGKWEIDYRASYNKKEKTCSFSVMYFNLLINHPDTIKALKEANPYFSFYFNSQSVVMNSKPVRVKKMDDVKKAFYEFVKNWNESGIFGIYNKFKTNDELKKK